MSDIWITASLMIVCLIAEGFFSGSELGVVSADRMKLRHDAAKGSRGARMALDMLEKRPEWLLSTTLVGTNIAIVANSTIVTALMISLFGEAGSWLAVVLVAPLIWVFGEIVPKSVFQQRADAITPYVIYVLRFFSIVFWPILIFFVTLSKFLSRIAGSSAEHNPFTLREQIQSMVQMPPQEGGDIQPIEKSMIRRMFNFSETTVYKVMVPLIDVTARRTGNAPSAKRCAWPCNARTSACRSSTVGSTASSACSTRWTCSAWTSRRRSSPSSGRRATCRPARAPSRCSSNCARTATLMAVVMDEFGGAEGIVTIEDIIEEVVEDIQDEYDRQEKPAEWFRKLGHHDYLVSARADPAMLLEKLGLKLPGEADYDTLSGFLLEFAHEIPKPGTTIEVEGIKFTIQRATPQVVQEVQIRW